MEAQVGDAFDGDEWQRVVSERLDAGDFQLLIAVDAIDEPLRRTVEYLNSRATFSVLAVTLEHVTEGGVQVVTPNVFGEEATRAKRNPEGGPAVEDADTVVVAASRAYPAFLLAGAYVCKPGRAFRQDARFLGFYAHRRIEPQVPAIVERRDPVPFTYAESDRLRSTGNATDEKLATVIQRCLDPATPNPREEGKEYQVLPLDAARGFELPTPVQHPTGFAWTLGQRYTRSDALRKGPSDTQGLNALGG